MDSFWTVIKTPELGDTITLAGGNVYLPAPNGNIWLIEDSGGFLTLITEEDASSRLTS